MKRSLTIVLSVVFVISSLLAGCGNSSNVDNSAKATVQSTSASTDSSQTTTTQEKVKIRMTYWNNEETVKTLLSLFKEKLPEVELEYQFIDNKQYDNVIETQLASGSGPDIIGSNPTKTKLHVQLGYCEDLSRYLSKFSESGASVYSVDGKMYALPGISWFEGIFYNKEIFEKHGLTVPKTFEDELNIHETLTKAGVKPQAMGAKSWEPMMKSSMGFVMNDYIFTEAGKGFDQAYASGTKVMDGNWNKAITRWSELIKRGYLKEEMLGMDYDQALEEFATGKAAMWESGPWALETIKAKNPNIKVDMFPFYGDQAGAGYLIGGPGVGFEINSASEGKDACFKVFDVLATEEGQKAFWQDNQGGSSYLVGLELPLPEEFAGVSETIKAGNVYAPWNNWVNGGTLIEDYGKSFQELLSGKKTVDEVLRAIDKRAAELRK